jgi:hypothetical protein
MPALPTPRLPPAQPLGAAASQVQAVPVARNVPQAAPAAVTTPLTVRGRLNAVNWAREVRKPMVAAPQLAEQAAPAPVQPEVTVRGRLNAVNWERAAIKPASGGPQLGQASSEPAPLSTVESFFSEIQW